MTRRWLRETQRMHREREGIIPKEMRTRKMQAERGKQGKGMTMGGKILRLNLGVELIRREEEIQHGIMHQLNPKEDIKAWENQHNSLLTRTQIHTMMVTRGW